jgi:ADP-heptose:LPS heptosyltransferase
MTNGRRLLILRVLGLGDLLTIVPALRALADAFPDMRRGIVLPEALGPLAMWTGTVNEFLPADGLGEDVPLPACDVAVNLHGRGPQSHRLLLRARPRRLIAFRHPAIPETAGGPAWNDREHEVRRWCRLLWSAGIPADPRTLDIRRPESAGPPRSGGVILLHPGAKEAARRWPAPRWAELARRLMRRRRRLVVTAGPGEEARAASIASAVAGPLRVRSNMDAMELVREVASADLVVCGDTGVAHLATALRRPSVLLFGPTPPSRWGPPPDRPEHRVLWTGRRGDPHGDEPSVGLLEIAVDDVEAAIEALATAGRPAGDQAPTARAPAAGR